ncbi:MAG TPA: YtzC family protein [Niallia sp.]|nr:YtzC family protein [Niallia sp.]
MATRDSMNELLERCNQVINYAEEQYELASRQEHYNTNEYTDAQMQLENIYNDLHTMDKSANQQQREELHRIRLLVENMQNQLTVRLH